MPFNLPFPPPRDVPLFMVPITKKNTLAPLSSPQTYFSRDCDICTQEELNVCFSPGPESAPVGRSLITMEWAANGVCAAPQPPDPSAPFPGSPWRPVTEWQGAFYEEVDEVQ